MRLAEPFKLPEGADEEEKKEAKKLLFKELTQVCLWGNRCVVPSLLLVRDDAADELSSTFTCSTDLSLLINVRPCLSLRPFITSPLTPHPLCR